MKYSLTFLLLVLCFMACRTSQSTTANATTSNPTKADQLLAQAIQAHGGKKYDQAHYQFVFRDKTYTFKNDGEQYSYSLTYNKDGDIIIDILNNNGFTRSTNGKLVELTDKQLNNYSNALNSVIYFATLPHKLVDPAVNLADAGTAIIAGKKYDRLKVYFTEEGGGKDHDDEFMYWINHETYTIDYLAYNYQVNGGGVRFRSAYNPRRVAGILFQDYVNYKAEVGTPLADLAGLFEKEELKKLSLIETKNVLQLK